MTSSGAPAANVKRNRLLVIDDDPIQREFAIAHLGGPDLDVVAVPSGQAGLAELAHSSFDIIVTDFDMPGMNGLELIAAVRADERTKPIPIILVTGVEDLSTVNAAYRLGVTNFAAKPVNWKILAMQIRDALGR